MPRKHVDSFSQQLLHAEKKDPHKGDLKKDGAKLCNRFDGTKGMTIQSLSRHTGDQPFNHRHLSFLS